VFLDFGMNFKTQGLFYEEFLKPRTSTHGLHDLFFTGILPEIGGIYREDLIIRDDLARAKTINAQAVFLSHAHVDHIGMVSSLDASIPLYASRMTACVSKALQDSGRGLLEEEYAYAALRRYDMAKGILCKDKSDPCICREYRLVDGDNGRTGAFLATSFSAKKELVPAITESSSGSIGEITFEAIPVDHSVYGATAYSFDFNGNRLVYTGDFRLHGLDHGLSKAFVERLSALKPDFLVVEGTNVASQKVSAVGESNVTESMVMDNCLKAVKNAAGELVVADFGPRNIERLEIFLSIANETRRRLVVTEKDIFTLHAMAQADSRIDSLLGDASLALYHREKGGYPKGWQKAVAELYSAMRVEPEVIRRNQGDFILAFGFFDISEIIDIDPVGGIYIYSTCEAFNEEMAIDVRRLSNWIKRFGLKPIGLEFLNGDKGPEIENVRGYHASGHVSQKELTELLANVKPGCVIPVHTEHPEMFVDLVAGSSKVVLPEHGKPISLS